MLLEEAHVLLDASSNVGQGDTNPSAIAQNLVKRMLAEIRSYGVGIIIADQSPRKVSTDVVALTDMKMVFRLVEATDKQIIADSMNMGDGQEQRLSRLKPGEAFLFFNKLDSPEEVVTPDYRLENNIDITLSEFDAFYYIYSQMLNQIENKIGMKCSQLKADTYISVASIIDEELQVFTKKNETNPYYIQLLKVKMDKYFGKKNVTNVKECLKEGTVYGPLCAYRLFYVGCSRAKRNLVIMINKKDIEGFEDKLRNKLMITGFNVL